MEDAGYADTLKHRQRFGTLITLLINELLEFQHEENQIRSFRCTRTLLPFAVAYPSIRARSFPPQLGDGVLPRRSLEFRRKERPGDSVCLTLEKTRGLVNEHAYLWIS